ncbi:MAG: hypothetical protein LIP12_06970 [Clostridiales bacterium]|nr:hypothetical protein [Clostridiales bacterium]
MQKKQVAIMMGLVISLTPVMAYAEETSTEAAAEVSDGAENPDDLPDEAQEASEMVMGTVTEIGEDSITISVSTGFGGGAGEMPDGEMPEEGGNDEVSAEESSGDAAEADTTEVSEEASSEETETIEVSDASEETETRTITVTDETQYLKMSGSMGGGMGGGDAGMGRDESTSMEMSDGEAPSDVDGEAPSDAGGEAPSDAGGEAPSDAGGEAPSDAGAEAPSDMGGDESASMEMPDGEAPSDAGGEIPTDAGEGGGMGGSSETEEITLADIEEGDTVMITLNEDGSAATVTVVSMDGMSGGMGGSDMGGSGMGGGMMSGDMGGGQSSGVDSYESANTITEDTAIDSEEITSTGTDENAVLVSSDVNLVLTNDTISRESDDSTGGDNSSFYGVGAAVLATDGTVTVSDCTVYTDSEGGAGVFAYGDGVVYVMDTVIETLLNTSGGIHVAGGGTLYAWDVTATTNGTSSAAVRSDRGSGTMVVDGGTYTSNGSDSPAVYCTAEIAINDATLTSTGAEAVCIEGLNALRLYDCDLTGMAPDDERNDVTWTVIVYQSMSGDSEVGNGTFQMVGGTLTSTNGGLFYTTNTECTITLENVEISAADDCEFFLQCTGNTNSRGWGTTGSNGSDCLFTAISQTMDQDVIWDSISTLDFYMTDGSTLTGAIVDDETWAGNGGSGYCNVIISEDSTWVVTGDSTVTALSCAGTITDAEGNTVTVQGTDGTVYVEGTSAYTITVESYSETADTSGASSTDSFDDYAVERPEV